MIVLNDLDKVLNVSQHMAVVIGHARLINYAKNGFSRGFCHFLNFGDSDGLDIAYDGITKHSQHMAVAIGYGCIINHVCLECIINAKRSQKRNFGHKVTGLHGAAHCTSLQLGSYKVTCLPVIHLTMKQVKEVNGSGIGNLLLFT